MAGEDTQILANGNGEALTIIPSGDKATNNGNGLVCTKHNNNGTIPNGKVLDITNGDNGKLVIPVDEKINSIHNDVDNDDPDISCGWGPCRPRWLQFFATKQAFLATFCITWVSSTIFLYFHNFFAIFARCLRRKKNVENFFSTQIQNGLKFELCISGKRINCHIKNENC